MVGGVISCSQCCNMSAEIAAAGPLPRDTADTSQHATDVVFTPASQTADRCDYHRRTYVFNQACSQLPVKSNKQNGEAPGCSLESETRRF